MGDLAVSLFCYSLIKIGLRDSQSPSQRGDSIQLDHRNLPLVQRVSGPVSIKMKPATAGGNGFVFRPGLMYSRLALN